MPLAPSLELQIHERMVLQRRTEAAAGQHSIIGLEHVHWRPLMIIWLQALRTLWGMVALVWLPMAGLEHAWVLYPVEQKSTAGAFASVQPAADTAQACCSYVGLLVELRK